MAIKHKTFTNLRDLEHDENMNERSLPNSYSSNDAARIEDYLLKLVLSSDGQRYSTSLTATGQCGNAIFSREAGIIYQGVAFGCR